MHDNAWCPEAWSDHYYFLHVGVLPDTAKDARGISNTHQGSVIPVTASFLLHDLATIQLAFACVSLLLCSTLLIFLDALRRKSLTCVYCLYINAIVIRSHVHVLCKVQ
jgi:hypothetical protein